MAATPECTDIVLHRAQRVLEVRFADGSVFELPAELLRVCSPSAEVRGHSPSQAVLVTGKRAVGIEAVEPVGHYAVALRFDDAHASGLYSFEYLYDLGRNRERHWADYLRRLADAGASRDT
jgi:DUF971 family protein